LRASPVRCTPSSSVGITEHVRMPTDELGVHRTGDALKVAVALFFEEQCEEVDLEEQVTELVEQLGWHPSESRVGDLVGLLDRVRHDRAHGLLAIPRAFAPQALGQVLKLDQRGCECQGSSRWS